MKIPKWLKTLGFVGAMGLSYAGSADAQSRVSGNVNNIAGEGVEGKEVHLVDEVLGDTLVSGRTGVSGDFNLEYDAGIGMDSPYPNPTGDVSNLVVTSVGGNKKVAAYNVLGQVVGSGDFDFGEGSNKITIGPFPSSGVYLVNVRGDDFNETAKLTSIGGRGDFSIDVVSKGGSGGVSPVSLVVDGGLNYEDFRSGVPFGRDVNKEVTLEDKLFDVVSRGRLVDVDGRDVSGLLVKSFDGFVKEKVVGGDFEFSNSVPKRLRGEGVSYVFSGVGFEESSFDKSLEDLVDLGDVVLERVPPVLSVSDPVRVDWFSGDFGIDASSVNGLDSLVLDVDGVVYGWGVSGEEVSKSVSHFFEGVGSVPYTVRAFDVYGTENVLEGVVDVRDRHGFRVEARGFFNKDPNPYASIHARHLESGGDTLMVANDKGVIEGVLPEGNYAFLLGGGEEASVVDGVPVMSEVNRLLVSYDNHPAPSMFWHGAERDGVPVTYLVSGYGPTELENVRFNSSNIPVLFRHEGVFDSHLETVENLFDVDTHGYFVDEWGQFARPFPVNPLDLDNSDKYPTLVLPDASQEQVVVYNLGNDAFPRNWNVGVLDSDGNRVYPDDGLYPPGSVWNEEELANWEIFKEDVRGVLEDSLDINPYRIKYVEKRADELADSDYLISWSHSRVTVNKEANVMYVGRTRAGGIESSRLRFVSEGSSVSNHRVMRSSLFFVNGSLPSWYTNELRHFFGTIEEPNPGICSVKDFNTGAILNPTPPSYCTDRQEVKYVDEQGNPTRSGNPKDFMAWMASAGYGSFIQQQINGQFTRPVWDGNTSKIRYVVNNDEWDIGTLGSDYPEIHYRGANLMFPKQD